MRQGEGQWERTKTEGVTEYGCVVVVPGHFQEGPFELRVDGGAPYKANEPRPWFAFGDLADSASAGGWIRVVGEAITLSRESKTVPTLQLTRVQDTSKASPPPPPLVLRARAARRGEGVGAKLSRWHAFFDVGSWVKCSWGQ